MCESRVAGVAAWISGTEPKVVALQMLMPRVQEKREYGV
jgi:hypothetical protein